ncbi:hypothetical protein ACIGJO_30095 [Streptomyces sp. NPDC079020]|uniref:hypothetical protein n=1 Tax=Streptomyces sp. NPDC079020 TaxID=3365722 RepID=UPI0037D55037
MQEEAEEIPVTRISLDEVKTFAIGPNSFGGRIYLGGGHGVQDLELFTGAGQRIRTTSLVFASIGEYPPTTPGAPKFMVAAKMSVLNLIPYDGGVFTRVFIDWPESLTAAVDFLIVND